MSPPIDQLGDRDSERERGDGDQQRVRPVSPLRCCGSRGGLCSDRLGWRRRLAAHALDDEARLELAQECSVLFELVGDLRADAAPLRRLVGKRLEALGAVLEQLVAPGLGRVGGLCPATLPEAPRHFFAGGCSPVVVRQIFDATRRAAIAPTALNTASNPVHNSFRNSIGCLVAARRVPQT
jgi:hypothetical protein